ncbi:MAG: hypothetical protein PWQ12_1443, partial [Clostridiales bacterium]|nr:hypothetical protein [Clostridiales bacterium]
ILMDEFRKVALGRITLEVPDEILSGGEKNES